MANVSTMQPFAKGDIFAGATLLNRKDDDHAGDGRIIQYDSNLKEKGVLWTEGTTHLIGGLSFAPDGTLWAFDSNSFTVHARQPGGQAAAAHQVRGPGLLEHQLREGRDDLSWRAPGRQHRADAARHDAGHDPAQAPRHGSLRRWPPLPVHPGRQAAEGVRHAGSRRHAGLPRPDGLRAARRRQDDAVPLGTERQHPRATTW